MSIIYLLICKVTIFHAQLLGRPIQDKKTTPSYFWTTFRDHLVVPMSAAKCSPNMLVGGSIIRPIGTKNWQPPLIWKIRIGTTILRRWNHHWQSTFWDHLVVPKWSKNRIGPSDILPKIRYSSLISARN